MRVFVYVYVGVCVFALVSVYTCMCLCVCLTYPPRQLLSSGARSAKLYEVSYVLSYRIYLLAADDGRVCSEILSPVMLFYVSLVRYDKCYYVS